MEAQFEIVQKKGETGWGKYKFGNRVCDEWNGLAEVVMAGSLVTFKAELDHHLRNVRGCV